jgi:hypothetical protein
MLPGLPASLSLRLVRQAQGGQRETREAEAEFLQRPAARDCLGQTLRYFIELVVHNSPFHWFSFCFVGLQCSRENFHGVTAR